MDFSKLRMLSFWLRHVNCKTLAHDVLRETDEAMIRGYAGIVAIKAKGADRIRAIEQFVNVGLL